MTDKKEWEAIAKNVRTGRFYMCFEEPDEPLVSAVIRNGGEEKPVSVDPELCEPHAHLGCGYFRVVKSES